MLTHSVWLELIRGYLFKECTFPLVLSSWCPELPSARQQITNVGFIGSTGYNYTQDFVKEFMVPRILNEGAQASQDIQEHEKSIGKLHFNF